MHSFVHKYHLGISVYFVLNIINVADNLQIQFQNKISLYYDIQIIIFNSFSYHSSLFFFHVFKIWKFVKNLNQVFTLYPF